MSSINNGRFYPGTMRNENLINVQQKKKQSPQKPNSNQMEELYNLWCTTEIVPFPAGAYKKSIENRTKTLEKYIKNNNLDIEVSNLEQFFVDVKEKMPKGKLASAQYLFKRLDDYIKNGYQQNVDVSDLSLRKHELTAQYNEVISSKKDDLMQAYNDALAERAKINLTIQNMKNAIDSKRDDSKNIFG